MIKSTQKIIRIGSSAGVTIPAKELKRQNIKFGDDVEVTVRAIQKGNSKDAEVLKAAKSILSKYRQDFTNLAER